MSWRWHARVPARCLASPHLLVMLRCSMGWGPASAVQIGGKVEAEQDLKGERCVDEAKASHLGLHWWLGYSGRGKDSSCAWGQGRDWWKA